MTLTRDDAENSEDYCEGSDVEIATTAAVSFSVDVYDNNDDADDDGDDDDRVHQIKTSNDEGTLPQVCAPTTEAGNLTHLLCIIHLDGEGKG